MPFELRRTSPDDYEAIVELCAAAMGVGPDAPFLDRDQVAWKCWQEHPWWDGSRGYVIERDGEIAAHGCAWPVFVRRDGKTLPGFNLIDWAALDRFPGAGLILVKKLLRQVPRMYNIGGAEDTVAVLPRLGFQQIHEHCLAAKPLRPLVQAKTHPRRNWKLPARLARNLLWARSGASQPERGWRATRVDDPAAAPQRWWADPAPGPRALRSASWYRYILASPLTPFELYDASRGGESRGYFCLARCPGQARIADYGLLDEPSEADWNALAALALERALDDPRSAELTAWTSDGALLDALERAGFRRIRTDPVRCNREEYEASGGAPCSFTALDSDFAYLHGLGYDYVC